MKNQLTVNKSTINSFNGNTVANSMSRTSVATVTFCPWCPKKPVPPKHK